MGVSDRRGSSDRKSASYTASCSCTESFHALEKVRNDPHKPALWNIYESLEHFEEETLLLYLLPLNIFQKQFEYNIWTICLTYISPE